MAEPDKDILLMSTADWDNPFWTNKQHVAVELNRLGFRILYMESLGLRRPSASGQDVLRIWRRLKRGLKAPREVRPNLWVWSPMVLPLQGSALVRTLNRMMVAMFLAAWLAKFHMTPKLLWTYSPLTTTVLNLRRFKTVVYHAVDDIKAQPGMPRETIAEAEADLTKRADLVFVTSKRLLEMHSALNPRTYDFGNVADYDHFSAAKDERTAIPDDLLAIPGPRIGLIGAISGYKVDFDLLARAAALRPDWSFVLIGAVGEGDPWTNVDGLTRHPNIHLLGARPYSSLPAYLKGFDVAILATRRNEYTASMFPMKFFEYLAAGRPVVSTPLPALEDYGEVAEFRDGAEAFVQGIEGALAGRTADPILRDTVAKQHTYAIRMGKMLDIVAEHVARVRHFVATR